MKVGKKVKEIRKAFGKTLKELSELCGVSISYLSDIENERKNPSLETLIKIARALDVNPLEFLDDVKVISHNNVDDNEPDTLSPFPQKSNMTLAANRTDGYDDDLPEEAKEELKNFIDYLKVKYRKQNTPNE
ncbi:MAG: helix-turn-helix transcriptional regulator [Clostridiales bacterium]|nr:helix-turn-helix domain-containing protein [Eubacteriales bacterium]MDH7566897.1 helix-turn-helix transcriptional regulator [Clostridiales bacterium]